MNRLDWRNKVLARRSWRADVDAQALIDINNALNDAVRQLAEDCPAAFIPDVEHVTVYPDATQITMGRGVSSTADPYVFSFGVAAAAPLGNPDVSGIWDGIMHIEFKDNNGLWHRRQCREWWLAPQLVGPDFFYVSLDRPWPGGALSGVQFRVHQPEFFFRDDVTEVLDGKVWDSSGERFMEVAERLVSEQNDDDFQGRNKGRPERMTRGKHFQLEGPSLPPTLSKPDQTVWVGKEPVGTFRFCYTYVWGKKDTETQDPFGQSDPIWESAPSPVSAAVTITNPATKIRIGNLTNIDYMINFDPPAGMLRNGHSGLRKRIYVYRDTTDTAGAFVDEVEPRAVAHFLAEVDGAIAVYDWDGSVVPNLFRRLPEVTGYYGYSLVPHQDKMYPIDFRVRRRPGSLDSDYDAPKIEPSAQEALNLLALFYIAELDKQLAEADRYKLQYTGDPRIAGSGALPKLWARWGNTAKVIDGARWGVPESGVDGRWKRPDGNYFKA